MQINGIQIDDTFAEAFNMRGTRIIITARNHNGRITLPMP